MTTLYDIDPQRMRNGCSVCKLAFGETRVSGQLVAHGVPAGFDLSDYLLDLSGVCEVIDRKYYSDNGDELISFLIFDAVRHYIDGDSDGGFRLPEVATFRNAPDGKGSQKLLTALPKRSIHLGKPK